MKRRSFFSKMALQLKRTALKLKLMLALLSITISYGTDKKPTKQINYHIVKNDVVIGAIYITRSFSSDSTTYSIESNIKTKYILKFKIIGKETSVFKDGVLKYSSVFRKVNNKVKANHSIVYKNKQYYLNQPDSKKLLVLKEIDRNLVTLYFEEPKGLKSVFCDNLKKMASIQPIGSGKYKVSFSKGKYNVFHYQNGKCVKIEAFSSLFDVTLIPV